MARAEAATDRIAAISIGRSWETLKHELRTARERLNVYSTLEAIVVTGAWREEAMRTICCYCKAVLLPEDGRLPEGDSHGICKPCMARVRAEVEASKEWVRCVS